VCSSDLEMEITHVLRGDDHISNTPKQMMVYELLDLPLPEFGHTALIVNAEKKKLSKRDASIIQFIEQYEELGYLPDAMFNFIALLGWSLEGEEENFTKEEMIENCVENSLTKSSATYDNQ